MANEIIQKQIEAYRPNFLKYGNTPKGTFQNNTTTQFERFRQLLEPLLKIKSENFSICDVGAGVCDLHKFLLEQEIVHDYTGIEIVPEMVTEARNLYTNITLISKNILEDDFEKKYDFVILSGTFNLIGKVSYADWESFVYKMVKKMFFCAKIGVSFNTLTTYSTFMDKNLYYQSPESMLSFIQKNLSRFYTINQIYPLYETTYTIIKPEVIKKDYQHQHFEKYFNK